MAGSSHRACPWISALLRAPTLQAGVRASTKWHANVTLELICQSHQQYFEPHPSVYVLIRVCVGQYDQKCRVLVTSGVVCCSLLSCQCFFPLLKLDSRGHHFIYIHFMALFHWYKEPRCRASFFIANKATGAAWRQGWKRVAAEPTASLFSDQDGQNVITTGHGFLHYAQKKQWRLKLTGKLTK